MLVTALRRPSGKEMAAVNRTRFSTPLTPPGLSPPARTGKWFCFLWPPPRILKKEGQILNENKPSEINYKVCCSSSRQPSLCWLFQGNNHWYIPFHSQKCPTLRDKLYGYPLHWGPKRLLILLIEPANHMTPQIPHGYKVYLTKRGETRLGCPLIRLTKSVNWKSANVPLKKKHWCLGNFDRGLIHIDLL